MGNRVAKASIASQLFEIRIPPKGVEDNTLAEMV